MDQQSEEPPLSDKELRQVRDLIGRQEKSDWLWTNMRTVALWITAIITTVTITWDSLRRFIKSIAGS